MVQVDGIEDRLADECAADFHRGLGAHLLGALDGIIGRVRRQQHAGMAAQPFVVERLARQHVESGRGDMTGIEMVRDLFDGGYSFPVIFMTGSPEEKFRRDGAALGCSAFLAKPFPAEKMLQAIDQAIASEPGHQVYRKCA